MERHKLFYWRILFLHKLKKIKSMSVNELGEKLIELNEGIDLIYKERPKNTVKYIQGERRNSHTNVFNN